MKAILAIAAATVLLGGLAAAPAVAAEKKMAHKPSCYDFAWESQAMADCLAKGGPMPAASDGSMKGTKGMKGMKGKKMDMPKSS